MPKNMKGMVKIILFSKICVKDSKWKREAGLWLKKNPHLLN